LIKVLFREVEDCDAVAAGAEILMPLEDQFYGYRQGRLSDPFGHQRVVSTNTKNLTEEQMQQRFDEMLADGAEGGGE
jgi:PhnB protein